jgi:hypothetical protein
MLEPFACLVRCVLHSVLHSVHYYIHVCLDVHIARGPGFQQAFPRLSSPFHPFAMLLASALLQFLAAEASDGLLITMLSDPLLRPSPAWHRLAGDRRAPA